jgi:hypothetical protein
MASKFEKLIEYIINEDEAKAKALFHQIVISKSRDIYESLAEEDNIQSGLETGDRFADELEHDEDVIDGDHFQEDDDIEDEEGSMDLDDDSVDSGGDDSIEADGEELEDRVMDLEDAIDELKAEFDQLMADEDGTDLGDDSEEDSMDLGDDTDSEEDLSDTDSEEDLSDTDSEEEIEESNSIYSEGRKSPADLMREYVEKVTLPNAKTEDGKLVGTEGSVPVNKKSTSIGGKNDMGGTSANIARGGSNASPDGKAVPQPSNEYSKKRGDLPGAGKFQNTPGSKAGVKSLAKVSKPTAKDGSPAGAKNTDPASQNKTSVIESARRKPVAKKVTRK